MPEPDAAPEAPAPETPAAAPETPTLEGYHAWMNPDGSFIENHADNAPEELREYSSMVAQYKNLPSVFKTLKEQRQQISKLGGEGMVRLPGPDASDDERRAFYTAIGAPENADDYGLTQAPEGYDGEWDSDFGGTIQGIIHKHGGSKELAQDLAKAQLEYSQKSWAEEEAQRKAWGEEQEANLRKQWGDKYDANNQAFEQVVGAMGVKPEAVPHHLRPHFAKLLPWIQEDSKLREVLGITEIDASGGNPGTRANDIITNPDNPLYKHYHGMAGSTEMTQKEARAKYHALLNQSR